MVPVDSLLLDRLDQISRERERERGKVQISELILLACRCHEEGGLDLDWCAVTKMLEKEDGIRTESGSDCWSQDRRMSIAAC